MSCEQRSSFTQRLMKVNVQFMQLSADTIQKQFNLRVENLLNLFLKFYSKKKKKRGKKRMIRFVFQSWKVYKRFKRDTFRPSINCTLHFEYVINMKLGQSLQWSASFKYATFWKTVVYLGVFLVNTDCRWSDYHFNEGFIAVLLLFLSN